MPPLRSVRRAAPTARVALGIALGLVFALGLGVDAPGRALADAPGTDASQPSRAARPRGPRALKPRPQIVSVPHRARGDVPILGPRYAPVTIDLFLDINDRTGRTAYRNLRRLSERHPRRLRVLFRLITKPRQSWLAEAALEAFAQDKFVAFLDRVYASGDLPGREELPEVAEAAGVDMSGIRRAWDDERHVDTLDANESYRRWRRTRRWPALLFNGVLADRSIDMTIDRLEAYYDSAYERARTRLAEGVPLDHLYPVMLQELDLAEEPIPLKIGGVEGGRENTGRDDRPRLMARFPSGGYGSGPSDAPVTVGFYCSFGSRICARHARALRDIQDELGDVIRIEFHHFITVKTNRKRVRLLHIAAACAAEQDGFWRFHDALYKKFSTFIRRQTSPVDIIDEIAKSIRLDDKRFDACMNRPGHPQAIEDAVRAATKAGVTHAPTTVIGGRIYIGTKSMLELRHVIQQELLPGLLEQWFPPWRSPGS